MALFIVMSTGDFQICWNVMSLLSSERESGRRPLGLSDFFINILSAIIVFSTMERYPFAAPN